MKSYEALLALAVLLNMADRKMLVMSLVFAVTFLTPIPSKNFYLICALGELLIACSAWRICAPVSLFIIRVSALLAAFHALGWWLNGYPPSSPYHLLVKICEHAELLACILFSPPIQKRLANA